MLSCSVFKTLNIEWMYYLNATENLTDASTSPALADSAVPSALTIYHPFFLSFCTDTDSTIISGTRWAYRICFTVKIRCC